MKPWVVVTGIACALGLAFSAGRWSASGRTIERDHIVTSERDTQLTFRAYVGRTVTSSTANTKWRIATRWLPSGQVEQVAEAASETKTTSEETTAATHETTTEQSWQSETHHETTPAQADWFIAARGGLDLDRTLVVGGSISRRVLGPLFVDGWIMRPWTGGLSGGLGLGLAF